MINPINRRHASSAPRGSERFRLLRLRARIAYRSARRPAPPEELTVNEWLITTTGEHCRAGPRFMTRLSFRARFRDSRRNCRSRLDERRASSTELSSPASDRVYRREKGPKAESRDGTSRRACIRGGRESIFVFSAGFPWRGGRPRPDVDIDEATVCVHVYICMCARARAFMYPACSRFSLTSDASLIRARMSWKLNERERELRRLRDLIWIVGRARSFRALLVSSFRFIRDIRVCAAD